jgi:hypothetical protein
VCVVLREGEAHKVFPKRTVRTGESLRQSTALATPKEQHFKTGEVRR